MTSPSPDRRPTARDCARALRDEEPEHQDPPRSVPAALAASPRPVPKKALLGVAAAVLGAAGIAWATVPGGEPPTSAPTGSVPPTSASAVTTSPASAAEPVITTRTSTVTVVAEQAPEQAPEQASEPDDAGKGPGKDDKSRGHGPKKKDP